MKGKLLVSDIKEMFKISKADEIHIVTDGIMAGIREGKSYTTVFKKTKLNTLDEGSFRFCKSLSNLLSGENVEIDGDKLKTEKRTLQLSEFKIEDEMEVADSHLIECIHLKFSDFKEALRDIKLFLSKDSSRPILQYAAIHHNYAESLDGYRLCRRFLDIDIKHGTIFVSKDVINALLKIKSDDNIKILHYKDYFKFCVDDISIYQSLQSYGEWINTKALINGVNENLIVTLNPVNMRVILDEYKKAGLDLVKLDFKKDHVEIHSSNFICNVNDSLPIEVEKYEPKHQYTDKDLDKEPFSIAFNIQRADEIFKCHRNESVKLSLSSPVSPMLVQEEGKKDLILPVRLIK